MGTAVKITAAQQHSYADLRYSGESGAEVQYQARSNSDARVAHTVTLDTATGETRCNCPAARHGRACWHVRVAPLADAVRSRRAWLASKGDGDLPRWQTVAIAKLAAGEDRDWWLALLLAAADEIDARARREARIASGHAASDLLAGVA